MGGCDSKDDNVVSPVKVYSTTPLNESNQSTRKKSEHFIQESDRAKTVTTLTFVQSDLNEQDEEQIGLRVSILKKKSLYQRKPLEQDFIRKNLANKPVMYLIENNWSEEYTEFLKNPAKTSMREINNKGLLDGKTLKQDLREKTDYYPVTYKVWLFLKKMYGGGPEVKKDAGLSTFEVPICGIKNNHWMCYLNTGVQCLMSIGEFAHYFSTKAYVKIKNESRSSKKLFSIATFEQIQMLMDNRSPEKNLAELSELLEKRFVKTQQHDCHEFLRYYLEMLQDELNPADQRKPKTSKPNAKPPNSEEAFAMYINNHTSIVDLLFAGQLTNLTKCLGCENVSVTHDPFLELVLETRSTLESSLGKFFNVEKLADLYECQRCNQKNKAIRQFYISKTPAYLLIFVKRFSGMKKITDVMEYPLKLSLQKYVKYTPGRTQYNLQSVIVHRGTMDKGHYYCITKRGGKCYYVNDEIVKQITSKEMLSLEAYLLIYEREK